MATAFGNAPTATLPVTALVASDTNVSAPGFDEFATSARAPSGVTATSVGLFPTGIGAENSNGPLLATVDAPPFTLLTRQKYTVPTCSGVAGVKLVVVTD